MISIIIKVFTKKSFMFLLLFLFISAAIKVHAQDENTFRLPPGVNYITINVNSGGNVETNRIAPPPSIQSSANIKSEVLKNDNLAVTPKNTENNKTKSKTVNSQKVAATAKLKKRIIKNTKIAPELVKYKTGYYPFSSENQQEGVLYHPCIMLKFENVTGSVIKNTKIKTIFFIHMEEIGRAEDVFVEVLPYTAVQTHLFCATGAKSKDFIKNENTKIWCNIYFNA